MKKIFQHSNGGFTVFFAMLVASLALAVGLAIFDLTLRELDLSATVTQSEYAIYAADSGAECALYWDSKCPASIASCNSGSAFATSTTYQGAAIGANIKCAGGDITSGWTVTTAAAAATTTFTLSLPGPTQTYCVTVQVAKAGNPAQTTITAAGHNVCSSAYSLQLERSLRVSY